MNRWRFVQITFIFVSLLVHTATLNAQPFPYFDFDASNFKNPLREFGPYTRWWWPGNDVTNEELQREIKMFADNGFAGVEIQPLTMGINPNAPKLRLNKVYSWDTPSFYEHVRAVMKQAKLSGITVDMTAGSGWPTGGPHILPEEGMLTLSYADTIIEGAQRININVPKQLPDYSSIVIFDTLHLYKKIDASLANLQAVTIAKILKQENDQMVLDPNSVMDVSSSVVAGKLNYEIKHDGKWIVVAFWSIPDGQVATLIASRDPGLVVNHFDSVDIIKNYEHLFGERTGFKAFYGSPFRAVFNDSYEFRSDRHYSENFLSFFKQRRGYDITPWLGANLERGYNNNAAAFIFPGAKPPFVFSDEDWRLRYDYDLTVGELLQEEFINASDNWLKNRGLLHRTQAYGVKMDVISASGSADIPEAEQLFAKGSEGFIKLVTSGAHLYNRPVATQESFVFFGRSEMTTPQKIKALCDKAFTSGINEIIYSGSPYKYQTEDYGTEGWNTWSTPYSGFDFSSGINEAWPYWKDIKDINLYITRSQYALRSGKPHHDVLIYFPFADFTQEDLVENPKEILVNGYFKDFEPAENGMTNNQLTIKQNWFSKAWQTINALNESGITWEWVNDASIQAATLTNGKINIRGNEYAALLILNAPYIQWRSAETINSLAKRDANIVVIGDVPEKQPGFLNYRENDEKTSRLMREISSYSYCKQISDSLSLQSWISTLSPPIKFDHPYSFTRTIERVMHDSSRLIFIWNQTNNWQKISMTVDSHLKHSYWLDPQTGEVITATGSGVSKLLSPFGSIILYATRRKIETNSFGDHAPAMANEKEVMEIDKWNIRSGTTTINHSSLFDWRNNDAFKYQSADGVYTASFNIYKITGKKYWLDLGKVYFTAEVKINGRPAGKKIWAPYEFEITGLLQRGENAIEIKITPTLRNNFIYEARTGNRKYAQYKGHENSLMPAGLVGPVTVLTF
ncbi:MAG TPA: glycosyl hydrolase [Parafilimonas sp.]|nr:glycosyl hydrolase [Parafilimonas sp.]